MEKESMEVDWAELPPELIEKISKKITVYGDYLRFRSVCGSWHSSVPKIPLHLPPQLPFLMLSPRAFFDLSTNKTHHLLHLPLQPSLPTRTCGSSHGCLVILDHTPNVLLLNPLTRATRSLPPLHSFPNVVNFSYSNVGREYSIRNPNGTLYSLNPTQMRDSFLSKVVLSAPPSLTDEFAALAIVGHSQLAFCRNGCDSWLFVAGEEELLYCWEDAVYHNGSFFAVSKEGTVAVCDVKRLAVPRVSIVRATAPAAFSGDIHYVVFSGEGNEMMLVSRVLEQEFCDSGDGANMVYRTVRFEVYRMDWDSLRWEKVESLGGRALFLGGNSSLCFRACDFAGCCADSIYFTDDYSEANGDDDAFGKHDLGIFRLRDQRIEPLPCFSRLARPLPIWVSPNPC